MHKKSLGINDSSIKTRVSVLIFGLIGLVVGETLLAGGGEQERYFIIGQDLGAVRDYYASDCCVKPDGNTAYLNLYDILSEDAAFSGLGIDVDGNALEKELDLGTGPQNVRKYTTEFNGGLALGLEMVENKHPGALKELPKGKYDAHITQLARFLGTVKGPVWLRVGYEFDGAWNQGYGNPLQYKAAYRYVVDKLRQAGLEHVQYVWQASASPVDDILDGGHEEISKWYPGDEYVDWMGMSWFLGADEKPATDQGYLPPTQRELANEIVEFARNKGKPVMIAEASPQGYDLANSLNANIAPILDGPQKGNLISLDNSEIWNDWYAPLFKYLNDNGDTVRALAYINANWDAQERWGEPWNEGYWGDSRLQANPDIARWFNEAVRKWRGR